MKWAHYLLRQEVVKDPKQIPAPAGFISHFHETEITDPAELKSLREQGYGQVQVSDDSAHFTHKINVQTKEATLYTDLEKDRHFPVEKRYGQYAPYAKDARDPHGFIHAIINKELSRPMDLAVLESKGHHQIEIPAGTDHYSHRVDHKTRTLVEYSEEDKNKYFPPAPLSIQDHLFLAAVKRGDIDINDVHDEVLAPLNKALEHHLGAGAKLKKG